MDRVGSGWIGLIPVSFGMHAPMMRHLLLVAVLMLGVEPAHAADGTQVVVLVRHAEKAEAPADDVALSPVGLQRAQALVDVLGSAGVDGIVTTQFRRSRETAAPVAARMGLTPIVVKAGGDAAAHAAATAEAVRRAGTTVLVVGHSNTVPAIIEALGGPRLAELCESEYANLFVMALTPGQTPRLTHARYGAADVPAAADCGRSMKQ